jgi:putative copper export protein
MPDLLHNGQVLAPALDSVRLFLHVLAATIWVGGQLTLAALVPVLRIRDPGLPKIAARAFNRVAWPAFGVLLVTGVWNVAATNAGSTGNYRAVVAAKVAVVAASGVTAYAHTKAKTPRGLAVFGALTGLTALGALYLGILLAG